MKYIVRFSALIDAFALIEVESETPANAAKIARSLLDFGADFMLSDNGIDPIAGTIETLSVEDTDGKTVLELPRVDGSKLAALFTKNVEPTANAIIKIAVRGGVVEHVAVPPGITVKVYDYDIDGIDVVELDEDDAGDDCALSVWESAS